MEEPIRSAFAADLKLRDAKSVTHG